MGGYIDFTSSEHWPFYHRGLDWSCKISRKQKGWILIGRTFNKKSASLELIFSTHFSEPKNSVSGHFTPGQFTPVHFTPRKFHPSGISPHGHFTPQAFHLHGNFTPLFEKRIQWVKRNKEKGCETKPPILEWDKTADFGNGTKPPIFIMRQNRLFFIIQNASLYQR